MKPQERLARMVVAVSPVLKACLDPSGQGVGTTGLPAQSVFPAQEHMQSWGRQEQAMQETEGHFCQFRGRI